MLINEKVIWANGFDCNYYIGIYFTFYIKKTNFTN